MNNYIRQHFKKLSTISLSLLLLAWSLCSMRVEAGELHAILVGNTNFKGFWGFSKEEIDIERMQREIHQISIQTGLKLRETIFIGNQMTSSNLIKALTDLNVGEEDVIFFYYTGHGEHPSNKKTPWPNIIFIDGKSVDVGSIQKGLKQKKPRLVIALAQAGNKNVSPEGATPLIELKLPAIKRLVRESPVYETKNPYAELFLNTAGCITASAAIPDTYAISGEDGGVFTGAFINGLHDRSKKNEKISWQGLFEGMIQSMDDGGRFSSHLVYSIEHEN